MEKLRVTRADFLHALDNDIKPAFGAAQEMLENLLARGIINWGPPVNDILEDGMLSVQQAKATEGSGLVSVLIEGAPNSGKSALAANLAKMSDFPFVKVCSPEDMVGFTESAKCLHIRKIFDDAYRSTLSCIVVDNVERLLVPISRRRSSEWSLDLCFLRDYVGGFSRFSTPPSPQNTPDMWTSRRDRGCTTSSRWRRSAGRNCRPAT